MSQRVIFFILGFVAVVGGIFVGTMNSGKESNAQPEYMQLYPQPRALEPFALTQHNGKEFNNASLQGHWTLAFVGYTFCPDICPTTLSELGKVYPELKAINSEHPVQVVFISVDPKRDTVERLAEYIAFFNDEFVGATGPHETLFPLVRNMGMMYAMSESTDQPNYLVDHSSSVIVMNPNGQVIGRFKPQLEPGKLAISDTQQILHDMPLLMQM